MDLETGSVIRPAAPGGTPQALSNGAIVYEVSSETHPEYITEGTLKMATIAAGAVLTGGDGNDVLTGTDSADKLSGQGGNDRLTGGAGDDVIDGGAGVDTAVYAGRHDAYAIAPAGAGAWTVQDKTGNEGTDRLTGVERLHFADVDVALDVDGTGEGGGGRRPGAQVPAFVGRRGAHLAGQRVAHDDHAFLARGRRMQRERRQQEQGGQRADGEQFFLGHGVLPIRDAAGGAAEGACPGPAPASSSAPVPARPSRPRPCRGRYSSRYRPGRGSEMQSGRCRCPRRRP